MFYPDTHKLLATVNELKSYIESFNNATNAPVPPQHCYHLTVELAQAKKNLKAVNKAIKQANRDLDRIQDKVNGKTSSIRKFNPVLGENVLTVAEYAYWQKIDISDWNIPHKAEIKICYKKGTNDFFVSAESFLDFPELFQTR